MLSDEEATSVTLPDTVWFVVGEIMAADGGVTSFVDVAFPMTFKLISSIESVPLLLVRWKNVTEFADSGGVNVAFTNFHDVVGWFSFATPK